MIQICHLGIDSFFSPVSLLRVFPYAYLNNVQVVSGGKVSQIYKEKGHIVGFKFEANYEAIKKATLCLCSGLFCNVKKIFLFDILFNL